MNQNMLTQFMQFKKQMEGKDPKAEVRKLLENGQMTADQFKQLKEQAQALSQILK